MPDRGVWPSCGGECVDNNNDCCSVCNGTGVEPCDRETGCGGISCEECDNINKEGYHG